jgi:hypothetical protein
VFLPHFIYQRDYESNLDFSNQLNRGMAFFQYLENHAEFGHYVADYYRTLQVKDYKDLSYNLLTVWGQADTVGPVGQRRAQISFSMITSFVNLAYIETLAINAVIPGYQDDQSFTLLREHPLLKIGPTEYIILSINLLTDHLYKAQVFAFKKFLKERGYTKNFLSTKGKEFMEDIYLRLIMGRCFPGYVNRDGDLAKTNDDKELCDYYSRDTHNLMLVEFKDVLLNADIKAGGDKEELDKELDIKFSANQSKSPKGITQLYNAVKYLDQRDITTDQLDRNSVTDIYPLIIYTDRSFGHDGINKKFSADFETLLSTLELTRLRVHGVTFINLNYFELHEPYFINGQINIFKIIDDYQIYVKEEGNSLTPFEVFSRSWIDANNIPDITGNQLFQQNLQFIMPHAADDGNPI